MKNTWGTKPPNRYPSKKKGGGGEKESGVEGVAEQSNSLMPKEISDNANKFTQEERAFLSEAYSSQGSRGKKNVC